MVSKKEEKNKMQSITSCVRTPADSRSPVDFKPGLWLPGRETPLPRPLPALRWPTRMGMQLLPLQKDLLIKRLNETILSWFSF